MPYRVFPGEYLSLKLRAHELLRDVPLYDVSAVDLPGGGTGRSVADIRALESGAAPSRVASALYGARHVLGRILSWDQQSMRPEQSRLSRLSERDRRESEVAPGTRDGPFLVLYQFPGEALAETRNATVHGWICTALTRTATGYRLYWGVYVLPVSSREFADLRVRQGGKGDGLQGLFGHGLYQDILPRTDV
jgi:Protein of unknown function (DUF2867)